MDPQVKSILTSIAMAASTSVAAWAVGHGIIPGAEATDFSNLLVTVVFGLITAGLAEYKRRQATPTAQIAAVNAANNGVKVVSATVPAPTVTEPLK